jgi:ATP-dependent RNA helicase SUPV3L1/SUV3
VLATDGTMRWRGEAVAKLVGGDKVLAPRLIILADEQPQRAANSSGAGPAEPVAARHLDQHPARVGAGARGAGGARPALARGIAFQLAENARHHAAAAKVADEVKGSSTRSARQALRKLGVKFGAYHIYVPASLKPAPRELALILYTLKHGGVRQKGVAELPRIVPRAAPPSRRSGDRAPGLYASSASRSPGARAVRVDILERLADIIRPLIASNPATHQGSRSRPAPPKATASASPSR